MSHEFQGKTAVLTGAVSGFGLDCARKGFAVLRWACARLQRMPFLQR